MRRFGTQGPVNPQEHYVVSRTEEIADFINRVEQGKYIVLFAPRQTGKTTFFQAAIEALAAGSQIIDCFPIQLNFDVYKNTGVADFYDNLYHDVCEEIENLFQRRGGTPPEALSQLLENTKLTNPHAMRRFFRHLDRLLMPQKFVLIIKTGFVKAVYADGDNFDFHSRWD